MVIKMGSPFYNEGEEERRKKNFVDALRLFDQARMNGYDAPALYHSYAMLFRQMKEYDDEIAILDEAIERNVSKKGEFEDRRQKAILLLMKTKESK